jgi:hypothetical protein
MEKVIVSAGVFTREKDESYLPTGIAQIGAAIIGPTSKGPAFIPTLVKSYDDYIVKFGGADGKSYVPYTVKNYLKNAGSATIVKVAGLEGYNSDAITVNFAGTGSDNSKLDKTLFVLAPCTSSTIPTASILNFGTSSLDFVISGSGNVSYSVSLDISKPNYITNVLGTSPNKNSQYYVYANFPETQALVSAFATGSTLSASFINDGIQLSSSNNTAYTESSTPFIKSQPIGGIKFDLFKFYTFNHGTPDVKISIQDIKESGTPDTDGYATFTVLVRDINDTDKRPNILESYSNVNLNPKSTNFIAKMIGDQYRTIDNNGKITEHGDNPNKSQYVRVEVNDDIPVNAAPYGFGKYQTPISGSTKFPEIIFVNSQYNGSDWDSKKFLGFDFASDNNKFVYTKPLASGAAFLTNEFNLVDTFVISGSASASFTSSGITVSTSAKKFTVSFQGGFDGIDPTKSKNMDKDILSTNTMGFDCSTSTSIGTLAYKKAIAAVSNPDEFDINMLITPGLLYNLHTSICNYANDMCENRGDAFYLMDSTAIDESVKSVVTSAVVSLDSNFAGTYYPWLKIVDTENNKYMWVPPSVIMAGVFSFSDKVSAEWWAPAGLIRGGIDAVQVYNRLTQDERDALSEARINPIATFVGIGIAAWGQKTLQFKKSALDRINVRRLLITVKKYIASSSKYLNFEGNTNDTREKFLNTVNPYLSKVQTQQGLYSFRVVCDDSNNTPESIDRNELYGYISLQPTRTAEAIIIDFNVTRTGVVFSA